MRSYLEIGARHGDTFFDVMRALPKDARGLAVDLPGGAWGTMQSRHYLQNVVKDLREQGWTKVDALFGDSHSAGTASIICRHEPFDAVLIDADHRYEGVLADWKLYGPRARIVAFHDIAGEGQQAKGGLPVEVPRLWAEIKAAARDNGGKYLEIIDSGSKMGIGVVWRE